jgi:hypothetical protein
LAGTANLLIIRCGVIDQKQGLTRAASANQPTCNIGIDEDSNVDLGHRDVLIRGDAAGAVQHQVTNQLRQTFSADERRHATSRHARERRRGAQLRAGYRGRHRDNRQQQYTFAKSYHFILLVEFEIELMEVLFQPEPQSSSRESAALWLRNTVTHSKSLQPMQFSAQIEFDLFLSVIFTFVLAGFISIYECRYCRWTQSNHS